MTLTEEHLFRLQTAEWYAAVYSTQERRKDCPPEYVTAAKRWRERVEWLKAHPVTAEEERKWI